MQVARDANRDRPRPCYRHPLPFAAFPASASLPQFFRTAPPDQSPSPQTLLPCALARVVRILARPEASRKTEFTTWGSAVALPVHAFPKRSDGWKNVRNSSLSIA
jgi:hypothetical protein